MKTRWAYGLIFCLVIVFASAVALQGQERPKPPQPPQPPAAAVSPGDETPESPEPPAVPTPPEEGSLEWLSAGVGRAWLGVVLSEVTPEKVKELKLPGEYGAVIENVQPDSPAAQAGLEKGDVIISFEGERVLSAAQLRRMVGETPAGRTVTLGISRHGQTRTLSVKTEAAHGPLGPRGFRMPKIEIPKIEIPQFDFQLLMRGALLGISGEDLTPQLARYFGVKQGAGVLVREVTPGSAAAKAGLQAGDVIVKVGDTDVQTLSDLRRALPHDFEGKRKLTLTIVRDRHEQSLAVELEPPESPFPRRIVESDRFGLSPQQLQNLEQEMARQKLAIQKAAEQVAREVMQQKQQWEQEFQRRWEQRGDWLKYFESPRHLSPPQPAPGGIT
jgi:serine protease Do